MTSFDIMSFVGLKKRDRLWTLFLCHHQLWLYDNQERIFCPLIPSVVNWILWLKLLKVFFIVSILSCGTAVMISSTYRKKNGSLKGREAMQLDFSSDGGEWRAHGEPRSLFIGNALKIEGRVDWKGSEASFKLILRQFCMRLDLVPSIFNTYHGKASLDICKQWDYVKWNNFVIGGDCDVFNSCGWNRNCFLYVRGVGGILFDRILLWKDARLYVGLP